MKKRKIYPTTLLLFGFIAVVTLADLVNPVRAFSEMETARASLAVSTLVTAT